MKVLELCSGFCGWSKIWSENYHRVDTLDIDNYFNPTFCQDILDFKPKKSYDIVFASPPCTYFSKIRNVWNNTSLATTKEDIILSIKIAQRCFDIIKEVDAKYFLVENPAYGMRKYFPGYQTLDYCAYNYVSYNYRYNNQWCHIKKKTDIWTNIDFDIRLCDKSHPHIELVVCLRDSKERAKIPYELSTAIYNSITKLEISSTK